MPVCHHYKLVDDVLLFDVGESTKLVSEYKAKLQISEAENAKLEGTVSICTIERYIMLAYIDN